MATFIIGEGIKGKADRNFVIPPVVSETGREGIPANAFGTPVYDNLYFPEGSYTDAETGNTIAYDALHINGVLMVVNQSKVIVKTQIQGKNGTVKEYISDGDFTINATGTITSDNNVYPETELQALAEICRVPQTLEVVSTFLNEYFDIDFVIIENYSVSQKRGSRNEVDFTISMISDDKELELEENNG